MRPLSLLVAVTLALPPTGRTADHCLTGASAAADAAAVATARTAIAALCPCAPLVNHRHYLACGRLALRTLTLRHGCHARLLRDEKRSSCGFPSAAARVPCVDFTLNRARYTRYRFAGPARIPDAILILSPGFEAGAGGFETLAEEDGPTNRVIGPLSDFLSRNLE